MVRFFYTLFFITFLFNQEMLPETFLKDLNGKKVNVFDVHNNGPMAISFWFLACEPCKKEMKFLDKFNKDYSDKGFKVLSINTDNSRTMNRLKSFVKSKNYSFNILNDPKSLFFKKLGGKICPYLVLVDHNGKIVSRHTGYNPGDEIKLEKEIKELLSYTTVDSLQVNNESDNVLNMQLDSLQIKNSEEEEKTN